MNRKTIRKKTLGGAMAMSFGLTAIFPSSLVIAASGQVTRIGEETQYETAVKVATTNWTSSENVVLVSGEMYADAVSATVLSKQLDAPILLTKGDSLELNVKNTLKTLKVKNIYVVGGNASVSQKVKNELSTEGYSLTVLAGQDRYETNAAVARELVKLGMNPNKVMLVSGEGFSDALSAAPIAAAKGQILLLGSNNSMTSIYDFIKSNNSQVTVVGTTYSISDKVYNALGAIQRISGGADRFGTNLNLLNAFKSELSTGKIFVANASKDRYSDALIAASLAGKFTSPLILVDEDESNATSKAVEYIKDNSLNSGDVGVIGATDVIPDKLVSKIKETDTNPSLNKPTVNSITTNGLNQIKVKFDTELDEDSAENISNYQIDDENLTSSNASANLEDDRRTVIITLSNPYVQYKEVDFTVKNAIYDRSEFNVIPKYEQKITFSDLTPPVLESVVSRGGNKLVVKFSKPIRMDKSNFSSIKINRQSILNFGLNTSMTNFAQKSGNWVSKAELYFDSPLPTGSNIFTMPNGTAGGVFENAAGFPLKGSSLGFNIDEPIGTPKVLSVTGNNSGVIYVTYDRPMDQQTALEDTNYKINGSTVSVSSDDISFDENSNDTVVKVEDLKYLLKTGENEITIDNDITDTFGYAISETKLKFNVGDDTAKPQVTSVTMLDDETIRVKFNKDVSNSYGTNKSNYKIVDADGTDISYKIDDVISIYDANSNGKRIFDIKFEDNSALKGSLFKITIKNIIDTNSSGNVMDEFTATISGNESGGPEIADILRKEDDDQSVVVFFNRSMDEDSIVNPANYFYINGKGETKKLPASATIIPGVDNKYVTISFSSSYSIEDGTLENDIVQLGIANVKDRNGVPIDSIAYRKKISTDYSGGPKIIDNTAKITFDGDNIKVRVSLTAPLDILNISDFRVNGQKPDSGAIEGSDVILTFKAGVNDNDKIDSIKNAGDSTTISAYGGNSLDAAGRKIRSSSDKVFIPPTTVADSWRANSNKSYGTNPSVTIVFNQDIDDDIRNSYKDDFIFKNERTGEILTPLSIEVDNHDVIYKFDIRSINSGDKIDVRASDISSNITIRSEGYNGGDYTIYSPSRDDLSSRTLIAK